MTPTFQDSVVLLCPLMPLRQSTWTFRSLTWGPTRGRRLNASIWKPAPSSTALNSPTFPPPRPFVATWTGNLSSSATPTRLTAVKVRPHPNRSLMRIQPDGRQVFHGKWLRWSCVPDKRTLVSLRLACWKLMRSVFTVNNTILFSRVFPLGLPHSLKSITTSKCYLISPLAGRETAKFIIRSIESKLASHYDEEMKPNSSALSQGLSSNSSPCITHFLALSTIGFFSWNATPARFRQYLDSLSTFRENGVFQL